MCMCSTDLLEYLYDYKEDTMKEKNKKNKKNPLLGVKGAIFSKVSSQVV